MTRTGLIVHQYREFFGISHAIRYLSMDKPLSDQRVHGDAFEIGITATASTALFN